MQSTEQLQWLHMNWPCEATLYEGPRLIELFAERAERGTTSDVMARHGNVHDTHVLDSLGLRRLEERSANDAQSAIRYLPRRLLRVSEGAQLPSTDLTKSAAAAQAR